MMTYKVGYAGSSAGAKAMAQYLLSSTLDQKMSAAARYYAGEVPPLPSLPEALAQVAGPGDAGHGEAPARHPAPPAAKLRHDLSPAFAKALGVDPSLPLTETGIANLLDLKRADGGQIDGKRVNKPMRSLVDVFGLDPGRPVAGHALANVLAGKRVDGEVPHTADGGAMRPEVVAGPLKRFHAALGVPPGREPTDGELAHILAGRSAKGFEIDSGDYQRKIHAVKAPIGFVDLTFSADKSLSVAWGLAPTEVERAAILGVHERANADAMAFMERNIGFATVGAGGKGGVEPAKMAWISFQHFTARPTVDIAMTDKAGVDYTERREVHDPHAKPDPNVHTHNAVLASVLTEGGRVASLDLGLLDGLVLRAGAVYQARVAHHAAQIGIKVESGPSGEARFAAVPAHVRDLFSKRHAEAEDAARGLARGKGLDWDALDGPQKVGLLKAGAGKTRNKKDAPGTGGESASDFEGWAGQAADAGYRHASVLRPDAVVPRLSPAQRQQMAYENSLDPLDRKFTGATTLDENELRVQAARGFVGAGGIGSDPTAEIDAVVRLYRERGVRQGGEVTAVEWGRDVPVRGREVVTVTTSLHADQERELIGLMRAAAADKSGVLTPAQLDQAAGAFLARNPGIDPEGAQWKAQREMMTKLASAGRFSVAIGAAGAGKSTVIAPLHDAWSADGRTVYGAALANRQAGDLAAAGIPAERRSSIAAFLHRAGTGRYKLDGKSVVVVDEVSLLSTRDQLGLLRLQAKHGFTLAEVGDFGQMQSVDASGGLSLVRRALPDIPEVVTSIRQRAQSERENVRLLREGHIGEVLARKHADGTLLMVAGGRGRVVERVARLWQERMRANEGEAGYKLSVSTVSNRDVMEIGAAIRATRRQAGEIGRDVVVKAATDGSGAQYELALAVGDKVRLFDRVHDAATGGRAKVLANNGSIVEVMDLTRQGMVVRNTEGDTGTVLWSKLQKKASDPVRLTYGYAMTRNLAQGITSSEHIDAPLDGSKSTNAFSAYVSMSRHKLGTWMVLNEGAIRQQIASKHVDGTYQPITPADVLRRAGEDMGRRPERGSALDMLERVTDRRRGTLAGFQRTMEPVERQAGAPGLSAFQDLRLAMSPVMRQVIEYAHEVGRRVSRGVQQRTGLRVTQEQRDASRAEVTQPSQSDQVESHRRQEHQMRDRGPSLGM